MRCWRSTTGHSGTWSLPRSVLGTAGFGPGLHIGATVGRLSVCAEAVAFGRALLDGDGTIQTAVAVRHPKPEEEDRELAVVPPCGACREMILDHAPGAMIIVKDANVLIKLPIRTLLTIPYRR